jgi:UDP-3-O-[3-hydroxymyristoyl] glucosamine N-acyltransferase
MGRSAEIGENCHRQPRVVLYPGVILGNRVIIQAGSVLGSDGFGYVREPATGAYTKFPHQGRVIIEDDVEIAANCCIDRGALKDSRIRRGTKLDNLVHIAHNTDIGEDCVIAGQVAVSGSSTLGRGVIIAGQVGVGDHVHVGPGVILGGQAGIFSGKTVTNDGLKPGTIHFGTPARPLMQVMREMAILSKLAKKKSSGKE